MPPSVVIFDFFGTLTPATPAAVWDEHAARSAAPLGIPADVWRRVLDASLPERIVGSLGDLSDTFLNLARRCGVEPTASALAAACDARLAAQRELFNLRDAAASTLLALRARGVRLGVLSDCTIELVTQWPSLPVAALVDSAVFSCEVGRRKPDTELFHLAARSLDSAPNDCFYVGDGAGGELVGASTCGMIAVMLRADDWASDEAHRRQRNWAGPYLAHLTDVLNLLDAGPDVSW